VLSLELAHTKERTYSAREDIKEQLAATSLVAFVGGMAVGKNFLMQQSGLHIVGTETSRSPRDDDDPKKYTYSSVEHILSGIEHKELVQYGVAPSDSLYASRLSDYALDEPNVADIWHDAVDSLSNKGFKTVRAVSVMTPKSQWLPQLSWRSADMPIGTVDTRLIEARRSLRWSVAKHLSHAANHLIIINTTTNVNENVQKIRAFARGEEVSSPTNEEVARVRDGMFETINTMYTRLGESTTS
jgi:hypothetical protein